MKQQLTAEISGAGLAALTAATRLAQLGWKVRVHERNPEIRGTGAGIYIWGNGLRVLETLGARTEALLDASPCATSEFRDKDNNVIPKASRQGGEPVLVYALTRQQLLTALANAARRAGVTIATSSEVAGAEPEGVLILKDGDRLAADLVLGADGVGSPVRDSLDVVRESELLSEGAFRTMIERGPEDGEAKFIENWNGGRRVLVTPCSPTQIYLALTCPYDDPAAGPVFNKQFWLGAFPHLSSQINRIGDDIRWDRYSLVKLHSWSQGHIALTGDAAHAMPPNLGQGGGMAMQNALSLAHELGHIDDARQVPEALRRWENREREITEHTQLWSMFYDVIGNCPDELRPLMMNHMAQDPWMASQRLRTARHVPTGSVSLPVLEV